MTTTDYEFEDYWLLENLDSVILKAGVIDVWLTLPEEDRDVLRAMRIVVLESRMTDFAGLCSIEEIANRPRPIIRLNTKIASAHVAAKIFAHEAAHAVLRHVDCGVNGFEQVADFAESQANWLATRWGYPSPSQMNGANH